MTAYTVRWAQGENFLHGGFAIGGTSDNGMSACGNHFFEAQHDNGLILCNVYAQHPGGLQSERIAYSTNDAMFYVKIIADRRKEGKEFFERFLKREK